MQQQHHQAFYPPITAHSETMLQVSPLHQIYVANYGNIEGVPVIVLHGGPGSGTTPDYARFFDPNHYHIILADQRGAGKSRPKGEMRENTTQDLIQDIEQIRQFFNIERWVVFGGSWGSTLSLLYAQAYPTRVLGLIVRGIFLGREDDIDAFTRDNCPAALMHAREWQTFKLATQRLIQQANAKDLSLKTHKIFSIYYQLLQHSDIEIKKLAAGTLAAWEKFNSYLEATAEDVQWGYSENGINMALTEATYFEHRLFIRPNQILQDIESLKNIPVYIVQGSYDLVCPSYMADELEDALMTINSNPRYVVRFDCIAGHSQFEPALRHELIKATNQLICLLS